MFEPSKAPKPLYLYGFGRFEEEGGGKEDQGRPHPLLQHTFLIQFLFKTDANPLWRPPPPPVYIPYSILIHYKCKSSLAPPFSSSTHSLFNSYSKLMKILSGAPLLLQYTFLVQFLFKIDENTLWSFPPLPVHIPYSILIQKL